MQMILIRQKRFHQKLSVMGYDSNLLLEKDIRELEFSSSLIHFFELNKLNTLKELMKCRMSEWFLLTGFSQHLLNEVINYLGKYNLIDKIVE